MKKLQLTFLDQDGKNSSLQPRIAHDALTAEVVRTFMEGIVSLAAFEKRGRQKYAAVKSAKYVETITTELF